MVFNTHGGLVRRDLFDATGGFDPWFSHAELVDWFRRLFRALPRPDAFDVVDAVTYVHHKREGSHSSDRVRVKHQRVAALQRYAHAEGVPPAELDAPMVNVETGCPEYKRVERDPDSPGVELLRGVPAGPGGGLGDSGPAPARFPDVTNRSPHFSAAGPPRWSYSRLRTCAARYRMPSATRLRSTTPARD